MRPFWPSLLASLMVLPALGPTPFSVQAATPNPRVEPPQSLPREPAREPANEPANQPVPTPSPAAQEPASAPQPASEVDADAAQRQRQLAQADELYQQGQIAAAQSLYRKAKDPFREQLETNRPIPISDPEQLSPAGRVYWREYEAGVAQKLQTRILVPLRLLVEQYPQFIPGQVRLAEVLRQQGQTAEAVQVLERATSLYPSQPDLIRAQVAAQAAAEQWLEASIAARQFALLNPEDPAAPEFRQLADEHFKQFQSKLRSRLTGQAIASVLTGALSYGLTGSLFGPISSLQVTVLMLQGESTVGNHVAERAKRQLKAIDDPEIVAYITELGQKLARAAGRDDFKYEFYVVPEEDLNAFALPGGKVFVNAGAILETRSEAELAGLLSHELAHAVLSHGFLLMTQSSFIENITGGNLLGSLVVMSYSRDMERQADILGTRILASSGYAADGMRNLMVTLKKQVEQAEPPTFLSSHPTTDERIGNLESLIERNGYNRYAFEGVTRHEQIQARVNQVLAEQKPSESRRRRERR
ncbi:M48 family metallopeptidase [Leptolyngbya sp. FACHB-261]|uniref:M48 family metallopeptidase n=1 Tax=Leptolyngbya sp. FACHB-261 TaxID=2692806 RepID=UPI0016836212|nr:M48 family metallopeptidase [Leptolyngbya sp. FACHB-261]MBD2102138.1 M48 family metalloprotease [Leptolyngbya sp. FACHB-261]